jgi:large subunit ribosomal protein L9e
MKDISSVESLTIPEGVTVAIKSRIVTVEGPRGKLVKNVGHVQMDIQLVSGSTTGMTVKQRIGMDWE